MKLPLLVVAALSLLALAPVRGQVVALPNVTLKPAEVVNLWPGVAPGEKGDIGPERIVPERPRPFDQITDVSVPTLAVFYPPAEKRTGTGVLVIPGGGLDRLAIETEGYEIAEWLNAHGITAFLLKYRVTGRKLDLPGDRIREGFAGHSRIQNQASKLLLPPCSPPRCTSVSKKTARRKSRSPSALARPTISLTSSRWSCARA